MQSSRPLPWSPRIVKSAFGVRAPPVAPSPRRPAAPRSLRSLLCIPQTGEIRSLDSPVHRRCIAGASRFFRNGNQSTLSYASTSPAQHRDVVYSTDIRFFRCSTKRVEGVKRTSEDNSPRKQFLARFQGPSLLPLRLFPIISRKGCTP